MRKRVFEHGGKFYDPMRLHRDLAKELGGYPNKVQEASQSEDPGTSIPAVDQLVAAARKAFGLEAFDQATGKGATDEDALMALDEFCAFMQAKKEPPVS